MTLTQKRLKEVLDYDLETGIFKWKIDRAGRAKKNTVAGAYKTNGYRQIMIDGHIYTSHRLAWLYVYGKFPDQIIDHINHKCDDNRISNLREVTVKQNRENLSLAKNNTSGYTGVYWCKSLKKWQAKIGHNKKRIHLGYFNFLNDAIQSMKEAEQKFFSHRSSV